MWQPAILHSSAQPTGESTHAYTHSHTHTHTHIYIYILYMYIYIYIYIYIYTLRENEMQHFEEQCRFSSVFIRLTAY